MPSSMVSRLFISVGLLTCTTAGWPVIALNPANAAWDLEHAAAMEDLLGQYIITLARGREIKQPRLFIYKGTAYSRSCPNSGIESPSYCDKDNTIYLEISLGDQVAKSYGDYGALSIVAHEFGHSYLTQSGFLANGKDGELAADRFAGGFARYVEQKGLLEPGDIDEARATFEAVGDYEVYHHDHHGTPAERRAAFEMGYLQGFRLPDEPSTAPVAPSRDQPAAPQPNMSSPAPTESSPTSGAPVAPILGLGVGILLVVLVIVGAVTMVNRARDDD